MWGGWGGVAAHEQQVHAVCGVCGQPAEPPELERCKGWAAGAPGFTLLPTACVLVLCSLMLAVPPPSLPPQRLAPLPSPR